MKFFRNWADLLRADTRFCEGFLSGVLLAYAAFMLTPHWAQSPNLLRDAMMTLGHQEFWTVAMLSLGSLWFLACVQCWPSVRRRSAFAGFLLWTYLSVAYVRAGAPSPGITVLPFYAVTHVWIYVRLGSLTRKVTPADGAE